MLGREQVVAQLNAALASELRAVIEYMVQAQTCHNLGQARLGARRRAYRAHRSIERRTRCGRGHRSQRRC
jgi:bacterioferritin (cytochrome b1)